ncbi:DUF3006 domain-containing protein [Thermoclostridium caenicola]|uniref:DUF3006 domain-containing protein n=1 Tax=Thermoclostridium caenicola TaxID=659425 RepID=A0A1M6D4S0_9FIRM|nr:DUF3006 domain-containing protein [Thermoclostridium caenicola]SHI67998.1 Protein of unknown function [Thermoclostridium caenicola]
MKVIIDRFEGSFAVCEKEDRTMMHIERNRLPAGAGEGDVLVIQGDVISLDAEETALRRQKIRKMMESLWE